MQTKKNGKEYVKLEEDGKITIPVDFEDPEIAKELSKFIEQHNPVLTFQFPKNKKNTVVIHFAKPDKSEGASEAGKGYNPLEIPSYIR
jgi:acylphosphatase